MLLIDDLFDRLVARLRRTGRQDPNEFFLDPSQAHTRTQKSSGNRRGHGILDGASNFVINQSTLVEDRTQIVQVFAAGKAVLDLIAPYTDPNAAVDSSARFPPPLCHPGTRLKIGDRLLNWLSNPKRQWNMMWLNGPAGTGKSAVAQTFAERCVKDQRLGAAFFFSRPNNRNDPNTVVPSLIYQLAVRLPAYKSLITAQLANDPHLMWKARHIQFNQLIVVPLLQLQSKRRTRIREPLLIVLDGLDECRGENAQREIIEMISEASRLKKDLPLLWLVSSRPEAHLKFVFSQADYTVNCGRAELAIDAESIADVDLYLQDGLTGIKTHFQDVVTPTWPPEEQVTKLLKKASGHFGFASTALRYIGDVTSATPMAQLDDLLSFLAGVSDGTSNPLEALDALYAGILLDVPDKVLHITKQLLDQATFYSALRKLHSVIDVPTPDAASEAHLRPYHASFEDYLRDPLRSGGFINADNMWLSFTKMCFSWMKIDVELFHINDSPLERIRSHEHGVLPGLKWVSDRNRAEISSAVAYGAWHDFWQFSTLAKWDGDFLSQIHSFDFRYTHMWPAFTLGYQWLEFVDKLWEADPSSGIIRTEPRSEVDFRLLQYMYSMTNRREPPAPATFPFKGRAPQNSCYFLVGHGSKAIACWAEEGGYEWMGCGTALSKEGIDVYKAWTIRRPDRFDKFGEIVMSGGNSD